MSDSFILRDRKWREQNERVTLSSYATFSGDSLGRNQEEPQDTFRTCFERDRDRIIHSKTFRRLKHKTQVFINPDGDHFITRMTHTLNVTQIGRSIAKTLPVGLSTEVSPNGPLSVKNKELFFSLRIILFGPLRALPSKSLITGVISIL